MARRPGEQLRRPLALVTGATAGIGAGFARRLAAAGHDLILVARDGERLSRLAGELRRAHGVGAEPFVADLTAARQLAGVERRLSTEERLSVLVNNAGFGIGARFLEAGAALHDRMVRVHVLAAVRLARAALPGMVARGAGAVVNVSSVAAFAPGGGVVYGATKAFLNHFSEALALEVAGTGVRIQALCPGFTRTEFHDRAGIDASAISGWLWLEVDEVVEASLRSLSRGEVLCVPGRVYRALAALLPLLPRRWIRAGGRRWVGRGAD